MLTNNIEGVHSSRKEIGNALAILEDQSEKKGHKNRFLGMVNRYVKLMNYEEVKIDSCQDIRNIYDEIVLEEVLLEDKNNAPDGKIFRKEQTTIRSAADKPIHAGITPERRIIECMDKALNFLHDESIEKLYRICLFHYLLEYIHPFYDGNGRLGRFILSYCISETLESILAYRISETIKENIKWYNNSFEICNDQKNMGDLTPFLIMMFTMIKTSEEELIASLSRKQVSWDRYQKKIQEYCSDAVKKKGNFYNLLIQATLFSELGISMEELTENLKLSEGTVRKYINSAKEKDLIITHRESRQFYYMLNTDVLDLE